MPREEAERYLAYDDARWIEWSALGMLTPTQREVGPPRIEHG
jgi:hypothetical protein